jgi:predicted nucleotidyltransferase
MTQCIMRHVQTAPPFLPIFRSPGQARLLARLFLDAGQRWRSLTELARAVRLAPSSVLREVNRLARAGIVDTERIGNVRRVRANRDSRFFPELRGLVVKAFGPASVLGAELSRVPRVEKAYIFGSWARYYLFPNTMQEPPRDIDVLVVGEPDPSRVYQACAAAEEELGLEVTPVIVDPATWSAAGDPAAPAFLKTVRSSDLIPLDEVWWEREDPVSHERR